MERQDGSARGELGSGLPPGFWLRRYVVVIRQQLRERCSPPHNRRSWGSKFHLLIVEAQCLRFIKKRAKPRLQQNASERSLRLRPAGTTVHTMSGSATALREDCPFITTSLLVFTTRSIRRL